MPAIQRYLTIGDVAHNLAQHADIIAALGKRVAETPLGHSPAWSPDEKALIERIREELLLARDFFDKQPDAPESHGRRRVS